MPRRSIMLAILGAGLLAALTLARRAEAMQLSEESAYNAGLLDIDWGSSVPQSEQAQANLAAFLALIRAFESNDDYAVIYGGQRFSDFSHHPRVLVPINLPGYEGKFSTAAGAYQFNWPTWNEVAAAIGLTDFSPASQDSAAVELLRKIGALDSIYEGDFDAALQKASKRWASLPYSTAGQNPRSLNEAIALYVEAGGAFA